MSETKWSPEPWVYDPDGKGGRDAMVRADNAVIVAVRHRLPGAENEANMRLIAAAPDLYSALVDLDKLYTHAWDLVEPSGAVTFSPETVATFEKLHEAASKALKRARGEEP